MYSEKKDTLPTCLIGEELKKAMIEEGKKDSIYLSMYHEYLPERVKQTINKYLTEKNEKEGLDFF